MRAINPSQEPLSGLWLIEQILHELPTHLLPLSNGLCLLFRTFMYCLLSEYFRMKVQMRGCGNTSMEQQRPRVMKYVDCDADAAAAAATVNAIVYAA